MSYYRPRLPDWLWLTLAIFGVLAALVWVASRSLDAAHERGRTAAVADAKKAAEMVWPAERARWQRERDSLVAEAARRDTVLVDRIRRVTSVDTLTLTDTVIVRETLAACSALAADCAAFRATATAALAKADSVRVSDSTRTWALLLSHGAVTDSLRRTERQRDRRLSWRGVLGVGTASAGAGVLLCVVLCK